MNYFGAVLPPEFYNRDPRRVSRALLGKVLVRREGRKTLAARIVEVEAYLGANDAAAHAAAGRTARNDVLFGPPGRAYIYFIYGNHYCLNVSCLPDGLAGGVLFRALEPLAGMEEMARRRGISLASGANGREKVGRRGSVALQRHVNRSNSSRALAPEVRFSCELRNLIAGARDLRKLTSGPGRLAEAFGITRERDNGKDLTSAKSDLWVADDGFRPRKVLVTPRIGINKAAELPLRYIIAGNLFVSGRAVNLRA